MHHKNRFHNVLTVFSLLAICACPLVKAGDNAFLRGDSNTDARVDLSDAIFTLAYLFQGGEGQELLMAPERLHGRFRFHAREGCPREQPAG